MHRVRACCFTGHRPKDLPRGGDESTREMRLLKLSLMQAVQRAVAEGLQATLVFVVQMLLPSVNLYGALALSRAALMRGEIWRLVTFIFLPPNSSFVWILFSLYFYWMIGSALENQWGSSRFTLFYLIGMLGTILAVLITGGYADNTYLNLSLFLAFAAMNPNFRMLIFFVIPIKIKYLAIADIVIYLIAFITGGWNTRLMILLSLANLFLFMGGDIINAVRNEMRYFKTRQNFRRAMR